MCNLEIYQKGRAMMTLPFYLAKLNDLSIEFRSDSSFPFSLAFSFSFALIFAILVVEIVAILQGMEFL